jgi:hypothetical protein
MIFKLPEITKLETEFIEIVIVKIIVASFQSQLDSRFFVPASNAVPKNVRALLNDCVGRENFLIFEAMEV